MEQIFEETAIAKYYIQSHLYKIVLLAHSPLGAAKRALRKWLQRDRDKFNPGPITHVSEIGFDDPDGEFDKRHASDNMFDTEAITGIKRRK